MTPQQNEVEKPFWKLVVNRWVWVLTSSIFAAGWTAISPFSIQVSWVAGLVIFLADLIAAVWLAGRHSHDERRKLAQQLAPSLKVIGIGPKTFGHYRIKIRNLSPKVARFRIRLVAIKPK
jgi:hypothetical protein